VDLRQAGDSLGALDHLRRLHEDRLDATDRILPLGRQPRVGDGDLAWIANVAFPVSRAKEMASSATTRERAGSSSAPNLLGDEPSSSPRAIM
jgi:hypothetical protein